MWIPPSARVGIKWSVHKLRTPFIRVINTVCMIFYSCAGAWLGNTTQNFGLIQKTLLECILKFWEGFTPIALSHDPGIMSSSPALTFEILAKCSVSKARVSKLLMPHGPVDAPVFMPVGTQGTMKGVTSEQLEELDCKILLGNTYHLGLRPVIRRFIKTY